MQKFLPPDFHNLSKMIYLGKMMKNRHQMLSTVFLLFSTPIRRVNKNLDTSFAILAIFHRSKLTMPEK